MANEFKVKNGIKFPDNTIQTTAATGGGGSSITVSDTAPSSPTAGALWWDSTIGQLRIYYNDGDTSQWVDAVNTQGIAGTNGTDGKTILSGTVNPTTEGANGDFYINTSTSFIFGPKAAGTWPTGVSLKGADGTGTVSSVGGTGTVSGLTLTGTVTSTGNLTLGGTLAVTPSNFASQTANTVLAAPNNAAGVPTFRNLTLEDLPDAWIKKAVKCATTANITLSGTQTIDGIAVVAGDRVLVKNQNTASQNGIYVVAAGTWTRALDSDTASELAGAMVAADQGTVNGGKTYDCDFKSTDTLGTTALVWHRMLDDSIADLYYRKNTATTLTSASTAQSWLGLTTGVTVLGSTIYEFEGSFRLTTTGTTSHTESILFLLTTATVTNMDYFVTRFTNSTTATAPQTVRGTAATALVVTPAITTAQDVTYFIKGTVAIGTGGNFNPQIQFSAAPGGTSTVILGSMFKMTPIGTTGSNAVNGTWA